jgi:hypothetical protein
VVSLVLLLSILEFAAAWRRSRSNPIPHMRWPSLLGASAAYLGLLRHGARGFRALAALGI